MASKRVKRRLQSLFQKQASGVRSIAPDLLRSPLSLVPMSDQDPAKSEPPTRSPLATSILRLKTRIQQQYSWLNRWQVWAGGAIALSVGISGVTFAVLIRQPSTPASCQGVFWPLASASLRMYCAQELANQQSLEDLLAAIEMVNALGQDHPLRPLINRQIEAWADQILRLTEETFQAGSLERAVAFAEKIPANTSAYPQVAERIQRWRKIWAKGEAIYTQAESILEDQQDWRKAFNHLVRLVEVDNRYWSQIQFERLSRRIMAAQVDERKLAEAKRLVYWGTLADLVQAIKLAQQISATSDMLKTARKVINEASRGLMDLATAALEREDLPTALEAAQKIPRDSSLGPEAEDFIALAYAESWTWSDAVSGLEEAIAKASQLMPNRPLYGRAQSLITEWQDAIAGLKVLEQAQATALSGSPVALTTAIAQARAIDPNNYYWQAAQTEINRWTRQIQTMEDQPILDRAEELSLPGDRGALRAAIQTAQQIQAGRALYEEAQGRIQDWQTRIQVMDRPPEPAPPPQAPAPTFDQQSEKLLAEAETLASQRTPPQLAAAIEVANQVPNYSPLRFQAEAMMDQWAEEILAMARLRAQENPKEAIAIARQVPRFSSTYTDAQYQIQQWQEQR